ncbi:aminotransferase class V-fold PLP-dependent enzyme [Neomegalonema perideroedes]|uniref:aminotransferase class V-fold PLP-dependent enzyme n=1 Tax=Neomegalonema perideroedes TaxID=217219 RepID=UPI000366C015|nr:cysteine desulfurase [Neomegalonema perideroedes]
MAYDLAAIRRDFPALDLKIHGRPLVYLDSGASAQKPRRVIEAMAEGYAHEYANVHRGLHYLSNLATEKYEGARAVIARFLGAAHEDEVVFTTGSTESINLVSYGWAAPRIQPGDEILLSVMEHHANIVPWHFLRERQGAVLRWVDVTDSGELRYDQLEAAIGPKTKLVALTHMSNVLGTKVDARRATEIAHAKGVPILFDGSQAAVHGPVNVAEIGCDFYAITGHKLYGPSASGALYGKQERLAEMRPFKGGGDMIREVTLENVTYADPPLRFEAGTPPIMPIIGLAEAIRYLEGVGMAEISAHEARIRDLAREKLSALNWIEVQGDAADKGAIFSMTMEGAHPHDMSTILDQSGIAVRAGHHCAQPLMKRFGVTATCRASFGMYSSPEEVDALIAGLKTCRRLLG